MRIERHTAEGIALARSREGTILYFALSNSYRESQFRIAGVAACRNRYEQVPRAITDEALDYSAAVCRFSACNSPPSGLSRRR